LFYEFFHSNLGMTTPFLKSAGWGGSLSFGDWFCICRAQYIVPLRKQRRRRAGTRPAPTKPPPPALRPRPPCQGGQKKRATTHSTALRASKACPYEDDLTPDPLPDTGRGIVRAIHELPLRKWVRRRVG
jgi:hypothetical protein